MQLFMIVIGIWAALWFLCNLWSPNWKTPGAFVGSMVRSGVHRFGLAVFIGVAITFLALFSFTSEFMTTKEAWQMAFIAFAYWLLYVLWNAPRPRGRQPGRRRRR